MQKCLTDGKTDYILVNCITMLATVPFFELPMSLNGEKCQKAECFCGVERIKTKGRAKGVRSGRNALPQKT